MRLRLSTALAVVAFSFTLPLSVAGAAGGQVCIPGTHSSCNVGSCSAFYTCLEDGTGYGDCTKQDPACDETGGLSNCSTQPIPKNFCNSGINASGQGADYECCGSTCYDIQHDDKNCGTCGHVCDPGDRCIEYVCVTPPPLPTCGDGTCNGSETTTTCTGDCPAPPAGGCSGTVGCDGVCDSGKVVDSCGICNGDGTLCLGCVAPTSCGTYPSCTAPSGCDSQCGSTKVNDACGVCGGNGSSCGSIGNSDCHLTQGQIEKGVKCIKDDLNATANAPISGVKDLGIATISKYLLSLVAFLALLYLIYGGTRYMMAGDDLEAMATAKRTMLYSVVGLVITLLAYVIVAQVVSALYTAG